MTRLEATVRAITSRTTTYILGGACLLAAATTLLLPARGLTPLEAGVLHAARLDEVMAAGWVHMLWAALALHLVARGVVLRDRSWLTGLGLALALGSVMVTHGLGWHGTAWLAEGREVETCRSQVGGVWVDRHLGAIARLTRWDTGASSGEVELRHAGGKGAAVALGVGSPMEAEGISMVPVAWRLSHEPSGVVLRWRDRASGDHGTITLRAGEMVPAGSHGNLIWERFSRDLGGLGPAVMVLHEGQDGAEDRRWIFLAQDRLHDDRHRTGPLALEVMDTLWSPEVLVRVEPAGLPTWGVPAGIALLLVVAGAEFTSRRRSA